MKIYVGQIYVEAGANFPYSHIMQVWLGEELSTLVSSTGAFTKAFGDDYSLGIRISARTGLTESLIKGPTVFKKAKDVEYTLFLAFDVIVQGFDSLRMASEFIVDGICAVLACAKLDAANVIGMKKELIEKMCTDPKMLKGPWPYQRQIKQSA